MNDIQWEKMVFYYNQVLTSVFKSGSFGYQIEILILGPDYVPHHFTMCLFWEIEFHRNKQCII